jgi:hypothetical protein
LEVTVATNEEIAASLIILFATLEPKRIGAALNIALPGIAERYHVTNTWHTLNGTQMITIEADDVLDDIDDQDEKYTGTREHLNAVVLAQEIPDQIGEAFGYIRDDIEGLLRDAGLIKAKEGNDGTAS